jgi:hypothetical protein
MLGNYEVVEESLSSYKEFDKALNYFNGDQNVFEVYKINSLKIDEEHSMNV